MKGYLETLFVDKPRQTHRFVTLLNWTLIKSDHKVAMTQSFAVSLVYLMSQYIR